MINFRDLPAQMQKQLLSSLSVETRPAGRLIADLPGGERWVALCDPTHRVTERVWDMIMAQTWLNDDEIVQIIDDLHGLPEQTQYLRLLRKLDEIARAITSGK